MKTNYIFRNLLFACLLLATLIIISCADNDPKQDVEPIELPTITADEALVVQSANNFGMELLDRINQTHLDENLFISSFSVSTALSMTLNGAAGDTESAMKQTLGLEGLTNAQINQSYKELVEFLLNVDKKVTMNISNSNWYKEGLSINSDFEKILLDYYQAEVMATDFGNPATKDLINGWIEDKTNGKIKNMLNEIPANVVMYLINAIYFKADWTYQFDKIKTEDADFYLTDGSSKAVPMMYSEGATVGINNNQNFTLVDIPYGNGQFSFTAIMNNEGGVNDLLTGYSIEDLNDALKDTIQYTLELYMPKFKIEYKQLLNDVLIEMGMGKAFFGADLSNLFEQDLDLEISRVIHQSFLEVNEEGSEAAAATIVEIVETSVPANPPVVRLNQPFMFFIRERHTNTVLFSGKLMDPTL